MTGSGLSAKAIAEILRDVPLLSTLSRRELSLLAGIAEVSEFAAGDEICHEGEEGLGLGVLLQGRVTVSVGGQIRRQLGKGAFFGEIALLDGGPRSATLVADEPVTCLSVPSWGFRPVLKSNPALALKMLEEVCRRLRTNDAATAAPPPAGPLA